MHAVYGEAQQFDLLFDELRRHHLGGDFSLFASEGHRGLFHFPADGFVEGFVDSRRRRVFVVPLHVLPVAPGSKPASVSR